MILFVGLGNKGPLYKNTRHNLGFKVIDLLSKNTKIKLKKIGDCHIGFGKIGEIDVALAKPCCFMNESGKVIFSLYKKINPEEMVIIHDDMDIKKGMIKIKKGGASAGHKGVENIIAVFGNSDFSRIRVGIEKPNGIDGRDYVLSEPDHEEKHLLKEACRMAACASIMIVEEGIKRAMDRYNKKDKKDD